MKSLFIPTSSQNFNNILSTESISPAGFYTPRGFGYKRFIQVEPNPSNDCVLLFSKMPIFTIPRSDYDDYPMIVEVDTELLDFEKLSKSESDGIEVYSYAKTIYLHPQKTKIHFLDTNHLKTTIIASERSLEIKFFDLYKSNISIGSTKDSFNWNKKFVPEKLCEANLDNSREIAFDQKVNKIKGLYFGYLVGVILSKPIRDYELEILNNKYFQLITILKNADKGQINEANSLWSAIVKETERHLNRKEFKPSQLSVSNLKLTALNDDSFKGYGSEVFRHIANMLCDLYVKDEEEFKLSKIEIAFAIGSILKENISNWDGSIEQAYMNGLLDNIEKYEPFDVKSHPSSLIQTIAAFILKGEDPDKLLQFLSDNKILSPRIALGFWGATFGFASFPKTLFKELFNEKNNEFAVNAYCHFYSQVHNIMAEPWEWTPTKSIKIPSVTVINKKVSIDRPKPEVKILKQENAEKKNEQPTIVETPKCPKCGSDMVLREGKFGKFYGCSKYGWANDSCDGKLDYPLKTKATVTKTANTSKTDTLGNAILEYLSKHGPSKLADIIPFIKEKTTIKYSISNIASYIKDFLSVKVELTTIDKAKAAKFKDNELPLNLNS